MVTRNKKVWIPFSSTRFLKIFIFCNVNIFEWIFMTLYPCIFLKVKIISWCLLLIVWCFFLLLKDINPVIQPVRPTCLDDSFVTAAFNLVIFRGNENITKINHFLRMPLFRGFVKGLKSHEIYLFGKRRCPLNIYPMMPSKKKINNRNSLRIIDGF